MFQGNKDALIETAQICTIWKRTLVRCSFMNNFPFETLDATYSINQTPEEKQFVSAGYFGIGKQFNISKKVKGHTLALYRAEFSGHLVDQSKINLRLGFDLRTDKKRKKI